MGIRCADHATPSIRIIRLQTTGHGVSCVFIRILFDNVNFMRCICYSSKELTVPTDCIFGKATSYRLDDRRVGVRVPVGPKIFTFLRRPDRLWGPPSFLPNGYRGQSGRGVKLTIPPASAEVKKTWVYTSTSPYVFMAWRLIS
jgi:hypothetical protein